MDLRLKEKIERIKSFNKVDDQWLEEENNAELLLQTVKSTSPTTLDNQLNFLLPYVLKSVDSYRIPNKIMGIRCISHIMDNLSLNELRVGGIGDVLLDSLKKSLHHPEVDLLDESLPVIVRAMEKLKLDPMDVSQPCTACDEVLLLVLRNIDLATSTALKIVYMKHMPLFFDYMEVAVAKHCKKLVVVICECLYSPSLCASVEMVLHSLSALQCLIEQAKPVIEVYVNMILFSVVKMAVIIYEDQFAVYEEMPLLLEKIKHILLLVKNLNQSAYEERLKIVNDCCKSYDVQQLFNSV